MYDDAADYVLRNEKLERFFNNNSVEFINENKSSLQKYILKELRELVKKFNFEKTNILDNKRSVGEEQVLYFDNLYNFKQYLNLTISKIIRKFFYVKFTVNSPSLLSREIAERSGYFNTGCQNMLFVDELIKETITFEEYNEHILNNGVNNILPFLKESKFVLSPAVCLHLYPQLEGKILEIEEKGYVAFDIIGQAYRDEGGNIDGKIRLNEFNVHEIVFFGGREKLTELSNEVLSFMFLILDSLNILKNLEYSNDIFFGPQSESLLFSQAVGKSKIEAIGKQTLSSIASVNFHRKKFTEEYGIISKNADEELESMCLAFGVDRIMEEMLLNDSFFILQ